MRASRVITVEHGFTLVELLVVVIILAILAAVVVPSFGSSSEDAKVSTLRADLVRLRDAIERYAAGHGGRYPGAVLASDGQTPPANPGACQSAAVAQLTRFTDAAGVASATRSAVFRYGPYLKDDAFPGNPFIANAAAIELTCDIATTDITAAPTANGGSGWKLYLRTGRLVANDATTLADGRETVDF